ncbi:MAG: cell filamentation protein Fic [Candidatus Cloacimonadota bacterium]|nr:MAG: cell filamentation protein Fic [Candidatus Cloacimonadota bacterium]
MWIYENKNWPNFIWDEKNISKKLINIRHFQGKLLGKMENISFDLQSEANLKTLTNDIIKSSIIEGENLSFNEVRSSLARHLGIDIGGLITISHNVDGIVNVILDATKNFNKPLTKNRLFDWHGALFPTGRSGINKITVGNWRSSKSGPMQIVSGIFGKETVHFEAPHADSIHQEMKLFLEWFEKDNSIDPLLKAGIAHFWFVTVHPFDDGNGRIARAIADLALTRADNTPNRFYSLSTQIELERQEYYNLLEKQQTGSLDLSPWLNWFLDCTDRAILNANETLKKVLLKATIWSEINKLSINKRQRLIINKMLEDDFKGYMNSSKYSKLTKCSNDTALRDIKVLQSYKIFIKNLSGGRSTSYRLSFLD